MKFKKYLENLHDAAQINKANYIIVSGNEAADMDSVCSAIVTAFLITKTTKYLAIPYIQIPREDLKLHKDVCYVLKRTSIDESWLIFKGEVELTKDTPLFLVDHNYPKIPGRLIGVIDHHENEVPNRSIKKIVPFKLARCGSCMSAVVNHFLFTQDTTYSLFEANGELVSLALASIVSDTGNLTKKVETQDLDAIHFLSQFRPEFQPKNEYLEMKSLKQDISSFTTNDLLRRDYKQWNCMGISTLPKRFKKCFKKTGLQELATEMVKYKAANKLTTLAVISGGKKSRDFAILGPVDLDVAKYCPQLKLELISEILGVKIYNQHNIYASRKTIAPLLRKIKC